MLVIYGFVALCVLTRISVDCGKIEILKNFDVSRHMGIWYSPVISEKINLCLSYNWFAASSGEIQMNVSATLGPWTYEGDKVIKETDPYILELLKNNSERVTRLTRKIPDAILGTDYISYSVLYDPLSADESIVQIWTREPHPRQSVINEALKVVKQHGFSVEKFTRIDEYCWESHVADNEQN